MNKKSFILIGPAGSGKGTQSLKLSEYLSKKGNQVMSISIGQELREMSKSGTSVSEKLKEELRAGHIVPSFFPIVAWGNKLLNCSGKFDTLIIDGVRKRIEAIITVEALEYSDFGDLTVFFINIPVEESVTRLLKRKRFDDVKESIEKRQRYFEEIVMQSVGYLKELSEKHDNIKFYEIDGVGTVEEVSERIIKSI